LFQTKEDAAQFMIIQSGMDETPGTVRRIIERPDMRQLAYRDAARRLHPDNGTTGNPDLFTLLQQANSLLGMTG